jgi:enediyne polyketide synthase
MGFGGINAHVVLEGDEPRRSRTLDARTRRLAASVQDVELLLLDGASPGELRERVARLVEWVPRVSYAQLADVAAELQRQLDGRPYRAAVVVSSPEDAERRLGRLLELLDSGETSSGTSDGRVLLGHVNGAGRLGYLFPGQGSGSGTSGGALRRRVAGVEAVYAAADLPVTGDMVATAVAQPRIVAGSLAGLHALSLLGLDADIAVGHSLGEISALHWAGAFDAPALLRIATTRGRIMTEHSASGTMASLSGPPDAVSELIADLPVVTAGYNGPATTVVAGPIDAIEALAARAERAQQPFTRLRVSHAFHSPLVAPAADAFGERLAEEQFHPLDGRVISTVTGDALTAETDIPDLLRRQITDPVRFTQALELAAKEVDLFIEVGPGRVLTGLAPETTNVPVVALDTDDESLAALFSVAGAAFIVGASLDHSALFRDRLTRPVEIGAELKFFESPCEQAPTVGVADTAASSPALGTTGGSGGAPTDEPSLEVLRRLVAERTELPPETLDDDRRLLDDLHLSSITVAQIMNQAARHLGVTVAQPPTGVATATLGELAAALDSVAETAGERGSAELVEGAAAWARPFTVDLDEVPLPAHHGSDADAGEAAWQLFTDERADSAPRLLLEALRRAGLGGGVLVYLPVHCREAHLEPALRGAQAALAAGPGSRFVLVQHGHGAAGLAKTLRQEAPGLRVTIVHTPLTPETVDRVVAEVAATSGFSEVDHRDGVRRVPTLRAMPVRPARTHAPLDESDVMLVTGGGKGITAECAMAVASDTGARLALLGRSDPAEDAELAANLRRMADNGITAHYVRADVTDAAQVRDAVEDVARAVGPVTAVLHGAGRNEPRALARLDAGDFRAALAPKVDGLRAVLDAVDGERLRLLVTFGSIIGRAGLPGEAHYATANEWLTELTKEVAERHPRCRALCLEWSVWSGVGMGERLSVVESLTRDGITPIAPDAGIALMRRLVADPDAPAVVVVSGRTGTIDTVRHDLPPLPLLRFVEKTLVRCHGVELVTEVELNPGTDLYLKDHFLDGNLLFPAVFGMEAMAQVAAAATGRTGVPLIEDAQFLRPIVVPPEGSIRIRIGAVAGDDTVRVAIRSEETGFAVEHFRARLRYSEEAVPDGPPLQADDDLPPVPLDPAAEMYGALLFQGSRFQRLRGYHRATAWDVDADVAAFEDDWFSGFLPGEILLGDPGARDALMHGNQVCVPNATLLPTGVERIRPGGARLVAEGDLRYCATERHHDGDTYVYDIAVRTAAGEVVERWEGLSLRAVRKRDGRGPWVAPLLGPYLERTLDSLLGVRAAVAVEPAGGELAGGRRPSTVVAVGRAQGRPTEVRYRPDGRPEIDRDGAISVSHGAGVTLCVAVPGTVGCDVEPVATRSAEDWAGLLGPYRSVADLVVGEGHEDPPAAGTRVWAAAECLRKAGVPPGAPLTPVSTQPDWVVLASGELRIATLVTTLRDVAAPVVFAVLTDGGS